MMIYVPLDQIDDNPFQTRQDYDDVPDLAERIAAKLAAYPASYGGTYGLMQVPRGRLIIRNSRYPDGEPAGQAQIEQVVNFNDGTLTADPALRVQLAFGHRRLRAFRHLHQTGAAGYEDGLFPVHVAPMSDDQMLDAVWSENQERRDISDVERAQLLQAKLDRLRANGGGSQRDLADAWGLGRPTVGNLLRLLALPADIQQANRDGRLSQRQCQALLPVVAAQAAVDEVLAGGGQKWEQLARNSWRRCTHPQVMVANILENPDKFSSDDIRDYTNQLLAYAGTDLPRPVAAREMTHERVRQPLCKGCAYRINDTCLDQACAEVKAAEFVRLVLADASQELGIPVSDRDADFVEYRHDLQQRGILRQAYEQGLESNYVLGWSTSAGVRPFSDDTYIYHGEQWDSGGRAGIVIGTRGPLAAGVIEQVAAASEEEIVIEDIPGQAIRSAWREEAKKLSKEIIGRAQAVLAEALAYEFTGGADIIQALMEPANQEWIDNREKVVRRLVKILWYRGEGFRSPYDPWPQMAAAVNLLRRAGMRPEALEITPGERALLALDYWYDNRNYHYAHDDCHEVVAFVLAEFEDLDDEGRLDDDGRAWLYELERASQDIERKLEAAKELEAAEDD